MVVLYLGPDSLLPLGSILAAVVGFALLFWNRIIGAAHKVAGRNRRNEADAATPEPPEHEGL